MTINLFEAELDSVFALLGKDENSATFALGWIMSRCPIFRDSFLSDLAGSGIRAHTAAVSMQQPSEYGGFTDIEIVAEGFGHAIIEAKQGWAIPTATQLTKYAQRLKHSPQTGRIVSLSAAEDYYASRHLPKSIAGLPVSHRSWSHIQRLAIEACSSSRSAEERLWLREFTQHLKVYVSMRNPTDNTVYVVSLSRNPVNAAYPDYSWIDVVEKENRYFHPCGGSGGWPKLPMNYMGFRYGGELRSVRHVDAFSVVDKLSEIDSRWSDEPCMHFVYVLGPPMLPARRVGMGRLRHAGRVSCAIDTLLSGECDTLSDAAELTKARLQKGAVVRVPTAG
ncbi:hypothetical protein [Hyphomicrobium sp. NDB2Meth4]|uniref:hypothetical protein n=1 Tax=Hyphomicrobium sp. NDB2Meth4 TaxID=1892846 RepID=UPI0009315B8C|nr:hypothetical protein [Hyphomicrobium sp. NDB2Meth4]